MRELDVSECICNHQGICGSTDCGVNRAKIKCLECKRVFDLTDETDAQEWAYGHDCEGD